MDFEGITPREISSTDKDKYCMISLTCRIKTKTKPKCTFGEMTFYLLLKMQFMWVQDGYKKDKSIDSSMTGEKAKSLWDCAVLSLVAQSCPTL